MKTFKIVFIVILFVNVKLIAQPLDESGLFNSDNNDFISYDDSKTDLKNSSQDFILIENIGQIRDALGNEMPNVLFHTRSQGVDMYVTNNGISYVFRTKSGISDDAEAGINCYRLDMKLLGSKKNVVIKKEFPINQQLNYYTPEFPQGISPQAYKKVTIENVYNCIDLVYYEKDGLMKYDFVVKAGANPEKIRMKYFGAEDIIIDKEGNVVIKTPLGEVTEKKPFTYSATTNQVIESAYKVKNKTVKFDVSDKTRSEDIIIDPIRIWATYYGGTVVDEGRSICADNSGNVYVTGHTGSTNFPVQEYTGAYNQPANAGSGDIFILKFNSLGERLWATYYGGSANDLAYCLCLDNSGDLYVMGQTKSDDFPIQALAGAYNNDTFTGVFDDLYILKFNSSGARLWATYYGGNSADYGRGLCTDNSGNLYVTGYTISNNFPIKELEGAYNQTASGGGADAFILKFDGNCARTWATFYGGSNYEEGCSVYTDNMGNLYTTGHSGSVDFPIQSLAGAYNQPELAGIHDAYISKFNSSGENIWATFYGGSDQDYSLSICVDNSKNIFVSGSTRSTDYPLQEVAGGYYQSTFAGDWDISLVKFDSNCARLWSTYYGGDDSEDGNSICTDNSGYLYVTGNTFSTDFPTQYFEGSYNQSGLAQTWDYDAYILMFNENCESVWATYYGGTDPDDGYSICRDNFMNLYITGRTESENFPLLNLEGAFNQSSHVGANYDDAFILRFGSMPNAIKEISNELPPHCILHQNYPNPFISITNIEFSITENSIVTLDVYNIFGQKIASLVNGELNVGTYLVDFDTNGLPCGTYFYRLESNELSETKMMVKSSL